MGNEDGDRERERDRRDRERDRDRDRDNRERRDRDNRDRERDRDRDRNRDRDRDRDRDRRDRDRERERERPRRRSRSRSRSRSSSPPASSSASSAATSGVATAPATKAVVEPISIEQLIKQREEEQAQGKKLTFLSKEQRQQMAIAAREAEMKDKKLKQEEERQKRQKWIEDAKKVLSTPTAFQVTYYKEAEREREREREKERENRRARDDRGRKDDDKKRKNEKESKQDEKKKEEVEKQKEIDAIKEQYLGGKKKKKKIIKPSEKFKFVFDWDKSEDTSADINSLYTNRHDVRPLFGRGFIGGIDHNQQIETQQSFLKEKEKEMEKIKKSTAIIVSKQEQSRISARRARDDLPSGKHWSEKSLEAMNERDWRIFREDFNITTKGGGIPNPLRSWRESTLPEPLLQVLEQVGYKDPSPIQRQAIPIGLQGRDLMGVAETGSGKTCAFLLPLLVYILQQPKMGQNELAAEGPYALIIVPTRELAQQIDVECEKFATPLGINCISIVGGGKQSIEEQGVMLRKGYEIIIATPGRLNDCLEKRYLVLNQCNYLVMDEADRMINLGFYEQVNQILDVMPSNWKSHDEEEAAVQEQQADICYRRTVMFSATMPVEVERLSRKYLRRPAYVYIGELGRAVDRIVQKIMFIPAHEKRKQLLNLLTTGPEPPIIVFANTKKECDGLSVFIESQTGLRPVILHAGKRQEAREAALNGFKSGRYGVLVATDVASRGIDVEGVTHVINYDAPTSIEPYLHRIGRTGRAGKEGLATTLLTNDDTDIMYDLKQMLTASGNSIPPELAKHPAAQHKPGTIPDRPARKDTIIYAK